MLFSKTNIYYFVISAGIIMTSLLCTLCLEYDSVSAYTASITTNDFISFDISPSGDGTSIHSESINVQSDCRAGYNLTIATPEGSSLYKYENNTQAGTASFTAVDGTSALSSDNNTDKWGYTLTSNPNSSTVFLPLSSTQAVLKTPSQTASSEADINDTFDINYGAKVSDSVDPGTYQMANNGAIVYYLTMDTTCTQYTVSFNANGGTGTMENQGIETGEPTKLTSANSLTPPSTTDYTDAGNNTITGQADKLWTFWGWNTQIDGSGDWYKDKEEVEDLTGVGSTITLYAQWKQATLADLITGTQVDTEKVIDHNTMQDMSPETCYNSTAYSTDTGSAAHNPYNSSTNPNGYHTITLLDYRGKVTTGESPEQPESYTVSKLPDNLCWMTKNLNLGRNDILGPSNNGTITLTSEDSDLADGTTFILPKSTTTSSNVGTNAAIRITNTNGNNNNGTYYSWAAAVANTTSINNANLVTSVCPKNWDLPTSGQYINLASKSSYNSSNPTTAVPSSFLIDSGFTNGATFYRANNGGFYWGSDSNNQSTAFGVRIDATSFSVSSSTGTIYGGNKYFRKNIRCVAALGRATINYDGNGTIEYPVTGTTAPQTNVEINSTNTKANGFSRTGWVFSGWNTEADGTGTAITAAKANTTSLSSLGLAPGSTITLYAQWLPQYTITYVNNCTSWASGDDNCTANVSATTSEQIIDLTSNPSTGTETGTLGAYNKFNLAGWKIYGWTTNADGTGTEYRVSSTYTVPADSSVGGITLYAHWVPIYTVQYDGNGSDNDSTGMGSTNVTTGIKTVAHTNVAEGDTFDLFASNFKKTGYGFVGWSTDTNAWAKLTDNDMTNDAKIWGPNEVITAPAYNGTPITTLYAVWAPAETSGGNPVYLQGWTGCSAMTATTYDNTTGTLTVAKDSITALTDERDGNVYAIAKLADDNCWMIENLRLANTHDENGNTVATTLTTSNTNIDTNNSTLPITNIYNADSSLATKSNFLSPSSSQNSTDDANYGWCTTDSAACDDQSRLNTTNTVANTTPSQTQSVASANAHTSLDNTIYSYGNYYNWYSATAGYGVFGIYSESVAGDLCPAGWKLPYGGTSTSDKSGGTKGGFYYLANRMSATSSNQVNSNKFRMFPNNFIYSGVWSGVSSSSKGSYGFYWSAMSISNKNAFRMYFNNNSVYAGNDYSMKRSGYSVRCIVDTPHTVTVNLGSHVQSVTFTGYGLSQTISTNGGTVTLADGKNYSVSATYDYAYGIDAWSTTAGGTIGSAIVDPTTYYVTTDTTLSVTATIGPYIIQYDGNNADNPNGMGTTDVSTGVKSVKQIYVREGMNVTLLASNFKRAGYGFAGWSTDSEAWAHFTDNDNANDPVIYGPMETIEMPSYPYGGIMTLYAVWVPAEKDGSNIPVYLQDFTASDCNALTSANFNTSTGVITPGSVIALTDKRDNQVYAVAKLADNNCWMVENLRLEHTGTVGNNINDSSVTNQSLSQGYGGTAGTYGNFVGLADSESANFSSSTTSNTIYKSSAASPTDTYDGNGMLEDIGTSNNPSSRFPRYNSNNTQNLIDSTTYTQSYVNASSPSSSGTFTTANVYSYGNYYNWAAAMANTNYYYSATGTLGSEVANTSICPSNWHLPSSGGASEEFGMLSQSYGGDGGYQSGIGTGDIMSNRFRTFPNNFLYSGLFNGNTAWGHGEDGQYWSRSVYGNGSSYALYLYTTFLKPSENSSSVLGFSVRCLIGS